MILNREGLQAALAAAKAVVPARTPRDILKQVLLREEGGAPALHATDLERGVDVALEGDAAPGESLCLPAEEAIAALKTLPDERVEVSLEKSGRVTLKSPTARWTWASELAAEFPEAPGWGCPLVASLPGARLAEGLARVGWAVDSISSRTHATNRAQVLVRGGLVRLAATNGKCLAVDAHPVAGAAEAEALVDPASLLALLEAIGAPEAVELRADARVVELRAGGARAWSLASTLRFPPIEGVIPKTDGEPARLDAKALLAAVKRANLATVKESRGLRFTFESGACLVSTANSMMSGDGGRVPHAGAAQEEVLLSGDYLADALAGAEGELLVWTHRKMATVLRAPSREHWLALVMPISTEGQKR